jgi:hypothetical protein
MVNRIGLPRRPTEPIVDRDEITRLWLAERCFACRACEPMVNRLARWHAGVGEEAI